MIKQEFSSEKSKDSLEISYFKKSHKSNLHIKLIDDVSAHIELLGDMLTFLKNNGIQWVCVSLHGEPDYPDNTVSFKHEKTGRICCHVEGFEDFYLKNLLKMIKVNNVYSDPNANKKEGGWTVVMDKKKLKHQKFNKIKEDVNALIGNWNEL